MRLVLASGSPRRRELLAGLGLEFEVVVPDADESVLRDEPPLVYVERVARLKAAAVADICGDDLVVVAADTTVDLAGEILGKPVDRADALRMLRAMSGRTHSVHTAVAVVNCGDTSVQVVSTEVAFAALDDEIIEWYVGTGEPFDKAGGYAIQGRGAVLVSQVHGSVTNVVGLPLAELRTMLSALGR